MSNAARLAGAVAVGLFPQPRQSSNRQLEVLAPVDLTSGEHLGGVDFEVDDAFWCGTGRAGEPRGLVEQVGRAP